jgi:hypothetical protein
MTELFDRDKRQLEMQQPGEEEQSGRNIFILAFSLPRLPAAFLRCFTGSPQMAASRPGP